MYFIAAALWGVDVKAAIGKHSLYIHKYVTNAFVENNKINNLCGTNLEENSDSSKSSKNGSLLTLTHSVARRRNETHAGNVKVATSNGTSFPTSFCVFFNFFFDFYFLLSRAC